MPMPSCGVVVLIWCITVFWDDNVWYLECYFGIKTTCLVVRFFMFHKNGMMISSRDHPMLEHPYQNGLILGKWGNNGETMGKHHPKVFLSRGHLTFTPFCQYLPNQGRFFSRAMDNGYHCLKIRSYPIP